MKWQRRRSENQRSKSKRISRRKSGLLPRLEQLETRDLLAANVLADISGSITAGASSATAMTVEIPGASLDDTAVLSIRATAADGSTLNPAAVVVRDSAGNTLTRLSSNDNVSGSTDSLTTIGLVAGDYTLVVSGEGATSGAFQVQVSLLGDTTTGAGQVSQSEETRASAALIQSLGAGNFVTELFYQELGIDLGVSQFDSGMDADGDGSLSAREFSLIQANTGLGVVNIVTQSDSGAPVLSGLQLQSDTGVSATDRISTNPAITGSISDDGQIASFTVSLDGGAAFDLTTLFDPNASANFTLSRANLNQIAGGTLADGDHTLTFAAADDQGNAISPNVTFTFTLISTNTAPTTAGIADQTATEDLAFSLNLNNAFSDANAGDVLALSAGTLPSWLSFNAATSTLSGTPANANVGTSTVTITATDSQGATVSESFTVTVANVNDAPVLALVDQTVTQNAVVSINLNNFVSDPDVGDTRTFTVTGRPAWLTLTNGILSGTPANADVGEVILTVTVTDSGGLSDSDSLIVTVNNVNDPPTLLASIDDQSVGEGQPFSLGVGVFFSDPDGDTLTHTVTLANGGALPAWLTFNAGTNVLSGTPGANDVGQITIRVTATDPALAAVSDDFVLEVGNVNDAPIATQIPDASATQDVVFALNVSGSFSDPDPGDTLTFGATLAGGGALPSWLSFNGTTGVFSGTPGNQDVGILSITVKATDVAGLMASSTFSLNVADVNAVPTVVAAVPDQTVDQGQPFSLDVTGTFDDADVNDVLTLSATLASGNPLPTWLTFNPSSNTFSGTPVNADVGTISVRLTATDLAAATANDTFDITVNDVNDAPQVADQSFNVDPGTAVIGTVVGTVEASDADGDGLTFAITAGDTTTFAIDAGTGVLSITDLTAIVEDATFTLTVAVTDDATPSLTSSAQVVITAGGNSAPVANDDNSGLTTPDNTILEFEAGDLLANDTDADGDTLTITNLNAMSQLGAGVQIVGTTIRYNPTTSNQLLALHNGEQLVDTFQYTVSDGTDTDTATVTITVTGIDVVEITLITTDANGTPITQIQTGQSFELRAFIQDIRPTNPRGVFSAYLDVTYPAASATPVGGITHSSTYGAATSGSTATPGLLDEVGGVDGISALGGAVFEVFRLEFMAGAVPTTINFESDPTEDQTQHPILLFGTTSDVNPLQIVFGSTTIAVTGLAAALADDGSPRNPLDADNDGDVTPRDALAIIEHINGSGGANEYMDVNRDGAVSPMDVLWVVNALGDSNPRAAMGMRVEVSMATSISPLSEIVRPTAKTHDRIAANDEAFAELDGESTAKDAALLPDVSSVRLLALSNDNLFDRWHSHGETDKSVDLGVDDSGNEVGDEGLSMV